MKNRFSFFLLLCVGFLDYMGVGLVIPLFANLLFDPNVQILSSETSQSLRGFFMGFLISLSPLVQFFVSPIFGSLSDQRGRKKIIVLGLSMGCIGYVLGFFGVYNSSFFLLILYRIFFGISAATMPVIQAAIADRSTSSQKARNFALYNMALGTGFTFGPFLGGFLSDPKVFSGFNAKTPFLFAFLCTGLNLCLIVWKFLETKIAKENNQIEVFKGIREAKKALTHPILKIPLIAFFLFAFGWDYYSEFVSVTLKQVYQFSLQEIGHFFAYQGFLYALSTGILIKPFVKRFSTLQLLVCSTLCSGPYLMLSYWIGNPGFLWIYFPPLSLLLALFYPIASTFISEVASEEEQGEMLGVHHSLYALALILNPILLGSLVGKFPHMPIWMGSFFMLCGGLFFAWGIRNRNQSGYRLDKPI